MTFDDLGLNSKLTKAVRALGFETPMPIQQAAIPKILNGESDLVGLAQTGTGKTAAFGLPMLQLIDDRSSHLQGLVICPTRELCLQITQDLTLYARYLQKARIVAVYGGADMAEQIRQIKAGAQIIVATPGRLLDLMNRRVVSATHVRFAVLDEADEMFGMGFCEDIDDILSRTPSTRRVWLFSATMPPAAARIAKTYMREPVEITIGRRNQGAENIHHAYYVIKEVNRYAALKRLIDFEPGIYGLIFCRTRAETRKVAENLARDGYNAEALHGDMSQEQRSQVMRKYRERTVRLLVATDVAARGIDVEEISHVIHYNLPDESERYTHRSGRTARAGKSGASLILVNSREVKRMPELERRVGVRFTEAKVPCGSDICAKQVAAMADRVAAVNVDPEEISPYLPSVYKAFDRMSKEELIQRVLSLEFNRFFGDYRDSVDLNLAGRKAVKGKISGKEKTKTVSKTVPDRKVQRFFINIGRLDNINEGAIVRWVCDKTGIRSSKIGQIDLKREFSFFDVDQRVAQKVSKGLHKAKLDNRVVTIQPVERSGAPVSKKRRRRKHKVSLSGRRVAGRARSSAGERAVA